MGWLMGLEPKRLGNGGIVMGRLYEGNRPLRHPHDPRIYPWIYPRVRLAERPRTGCTVRSHAGCQRTSPPHSGRLTPFTAAAEADVGFDTPLLHSPVPAVPQARSRSHGRPSTARHALNQAQRRVCGEDDHSQPDSHRCDERHHAQIHASSSNERGAPSIRPRTACRRKDPSPPAAQSEGRTR